MIACAHSRPVSFKFENGANWIDISAGNAMPMKQPGAQTQIWSVKMYRHQPRQRRRFSAVIGNTLPTWLSVTLRAADGAGDRADLTAHAPAFVADEVAVRGIRQPAATRVARERPEHGDVRQRDRRPGAVLEVMADRVDDGFSALSVRHRHVAELARNR